jgi:signal transduction histidine kinase
MPESPQPTSLEQIAHRVLTDASNEGEALVSAIRIVFCLIILARFFALGGFQAEGGAPGALLEILILLSGIALSISALRAARRRRFGPRMLVASAALDAVVAHGSLLSTVLWHGPHYPGLLRMPDPSAVILVVFVTALRLSPVAAWVGTGANLLLMGVLTALDVHVNGRQVTYEASELVLLFIFIGSAGALASVGCGVARRLVLQAGTESVRSERARRHLSSLLREHHDVRTLLSSARLNADLIIREPGGASCARYADAIARDLRELSGFIESVKSRALGELAMMDDATPVEVAGTLLPAVEVVQARFPHVRMVVGIEGARSPTDPGLRVRIVGGARGLAHVLTNLLVNACEGDGQRGATTVHVSVEWDAVQEQILLRVRDDGPGFRAGLLEGGRPRGGTTKPEGSGLGMLLVGGLVEASGGSLRASNLPEGGAQVEVTLPSEG